MFNEHKAITDVIYTKTNIPESSFKFLHSQQKNSELPDQSEDTFKTNILGKYMDRRCEKFQNAKCSLLNTLCCAGFLRYYYVSTISNENYWQPVELTDEMFEINLAVTSHYSSTIPLMPSPKKPKCFKLFSVSRYVTSNKNRNLHQIKIENMKFMPTIS